MSATQTTSQSPANAPSTTSTQQPQEGAAHAEADESSHAGGQDDFNGRDYLTDVIAAVDE